MTARLSLTIAIVVSLISIALPQPAPSQAMTVELMERLIKFARTSDIDDTIAIETCAIFKLGDCQTGIPARRVSVTAPGGRHYFTVPRDERSSDVIITFKTGTVSEVFLTDRTGALRAAAIWNGKSFQLMPDEEAAKRYAIELAFFARQAAGLPH